MAWILTIVMGACFVEAAPCRASAQEMSLNEQTIAATPYDARMREAGALVDVFPASGVRSAEELFNQARSFRYQADAGGRDYWQTPAETQARWAGDCEDKALWLYAQLKMNGHQGVRLVVGRKAPGRGLHVWVSMQTSDGTFFILDPTMQRRIWRNADFADGTYRPIYSFDGTRRYTHVS